MSAQDLQGLLSLGEAYEIIERQLHCLSGIEKVAVGDSCGRVVAEDIVACYDVPRHANSAVDGYGFCYGDLSLRGETRLRLAGSARAGHAYAEEVGAGMALRVFTGATVGLEQVDTIMMEEDCREVDGYVIIAAAKNIERGANLRLAGDDVGRGDLLIGQGVRLKPWHSGLLAAQGLDLVDVFKRLRVGVLSTGDELCDAGEVDSILGDGMIYDSNRVLLLQCLGLGGYMAEDCGIIGDEESKILDFLENYDGDILLASGGMSLGQEDHMRRILAQHGRLYFWRLAIKPGRPAGVGVFTRRRGDLLVIGLPGNPVAAFTIYALVARAVLARLSGETYQYPQAYSVRLGEDIHKRVGRREFLRAYLQNDNGILTAYCAGKSGAGVLSSIAAASGFLDFADSLKNPKKGDNVAFIPLHALLF